MQIVKYVKMSKRGGKGLKSKILADGFIFHKKSYLKRMNFIVIVSGLKKELTLLIETLRIGMIKTLLTQMLKKVRKCAIRIDVKNEETKAKKCQKLGFNYCYLTFFFFIFVFKVFGKGLTKHFSIFCNFAHVSNKCRHKDQENCTNFGGFYFAIFNTLQNAEIKP